MSEYPEWLVERVASRLYGDGWDSPLIHEDDREIYRDEAATALAALGFQNEGNKPCRSAYQYPSKGGNNA